MRSRIDAAIVAVFGAVGDALAWASVWVYFAGNRLVRYDSPAVPSDLDDPHRYDWTVPVDVADECADTLVPEAPTATKRPAAAEPLPGSVAARMVRPL